MPLVQVLHYGMQATLPDNTPDLPTTVALVEQLVVSVEQFYPDQLFTLWFPAQSVHIPQLQAGITNWVKYADPPPNTPWFDKYTASQMLRMWSAVMKIEELSQVFIHTGVVPVGDAVELADTKLGWTFRYAELAVIREPVYPFA